MSKALHSRHNEIYLNKLRKLRESRQLRQADLCKMLGRSQGWVSYVESGQTTLHIIELRQWLAALGVEFLDFLKELDEELRLLESMHWRAKPARRMEPGALSPFVQGGLSVDRPSARPTRAAKPPKREVSR